MDWTLSKARNDIGNDKENDISSDNLTDPQTQSSLSESDTTKNNFTHFLQSIKHSHQWTEDIKTHIIYSYLHSSTFFFP